MTSPIFGAKLCNLICCNPDLTKQEFIDTVKADKDLLNFIQTCRELDPEENQVIFDYFESLKKT
jgi:hypothetical protein